MFVMLSLSALAIHTLITKEAMHQRNDTVQQISLMFDTSSAF